MQRNRIRTLSRAQIALTYAAMLFFVVASLLPLVWTVLSSLKPDPLMEPGFALPQNPTLKGYVTVFRDLGIMRYFKNSFLVAGASVLLSVTMITMSAYVIACIPFRGKGFITALLVSTLFIPTTAMTFPVYRLIKDIGLYNTQGGLILIYACSGIAISFFVIKSYFATIPPALMEAARIDGCGYFQTFLRAMLPIALPGIATAAVLAFLTYWNEYYWASLVLNDRSLMTVPALLSQFTTAFKTNYNGLFSAIVVILIPPVTVFACCSKFFIKALSGGAVKG